METLKTTTNIPTELDADVFARLFIYAKMELLKKAINDLFDYHMNEVVPDEGNIFLEEIEAGNLLKLLSKNGAGNLIESLSQSERISSLYREIIDASRENTPIDLQQCTSLYNASSDSELTSWDGCALEVGTPNTYPFNTEICPHNTRFPWIEPKSWNRR